MRVVVAMSGGVDSSVAAALLAESGHDVIGLSMQLYNQREGAAETFGSCCSLDDLHDARRVAASLGIPHYLLNFEQEFQQTVVQNFVDEYHGGTHADSVRALQFENLKFATLVARAEGLGAAWVATGHYAQVVFDEDRRRYRLRRGADAGKDQSYFLFSLTQEQLAHAVFPVGNLTKPDVRAIAARHGLAVADKPDSHEICFVPDGDAAGFVERRMSGGATPGDVIDSGGRRIGGHGGVHRFTVGQRRGLGLSSPIPLYVLKIDAAAAEVVVGPREELGRRSLTASTVNWIDGAPPESPRRLTARIRHRHQDAPATVTPDSRDRARVVFDEPQTAVTPGQAVVFYDRDEVVGGGWIASVDD